MPELQQLSFDYSENRKIRDEAIQLAVDGADEVVRNWSKQCYEMLVKYVNLVGEFMTEDFIVWCGEQNFPIPNEKRAFGGIIQAAVKRELIVHTGEYREMKAKHCHMNPKKVWVRKV